MKVSVLIITYNHSKFIAQAIESVLMQKVNFEYEIVIGEDSSTDNTRQILLDYQKQYSDKIRLLLPEKNLGMHRNFVNTLQACRSEYIAILEGDDYWIADDKLQKQVEFLDENPDFTICFHNVMVFHEDNQYQPYIFLHNQPTVSYIEDLLIRNFISTPSVMYRNGLVESIPTWFYEQGMGDWIFHILNAQYGKIGYIDEVMSAYRIHVQGVWSSKSRDWQLKETIRMLDTIKSNVNVRYAEIIDRAVQFYSEQLLYLIPESQEVTPVLNTSLPNYLQIKDINFIAFPDWNQPEELLYQSLYYAIKIFLTHPENNKIALFIDTTDISEEDADIYISSTLMNLMLEEELEESHKINVFLIGELDQIQWQTLSSFLKARIVLPSENLDAILASGTAIIPCLTVEQLIEVDLTFIESAKPYKLNIGCGNVRFHGWINIDIEQNYKTVDLVCDARQKLPFNDNSCDLIYNEHFLEHLTLEEGLFFLKECHRILKPEGILRIAMPSLEYVVQKYMSDDWRNQEWLNYPEYQFIKTRAEMLNIAMRWWGHQWLYDTEELHRRLTESGYINIQKFAWGKSNTPDLRNRETRVDSILICESQALK